MTPAQMVRQFHEMFGLPIASEPLLPSATIAGLRQKLLDDEVGEVAQAVATGHLLGVAQELADVVYVAYGTALTYGFDLDAVLVEVHRANMTKSDAVNGKPTKGPGFEPPDLGRVLP